MKRLAALLLTATALCGLAACDHPQKTVDQLRQEIAAYKANPTDAAQAKIEADLALLDSQTEKLAAKGQAAEAAGYRSTAENLRADYRAARMIRTMKDAQSAIQGFGEAFKEAGQSLGDAFRSPEKKDAK